MSPVQSFIFGEIRNVCLLYQCVHYCNDSSVCPKPTVVSLIIVVTFLDPVITYFLHSMVSGLQLVVRDSLCDEYRFFLSSIFIDLEGKKEGRRKSEGVQGRLLGSVRFPPTVFSDVSSLVRWEVFCLVSSPSCPFPKPCFSSSNLFVGVPLQLIPDPIYLHKFEVRSLY